MAYNGGCVIAMTGKDCVAIATDHRFGIQVNNLSSYLLCNFLSNQTLF